MISVEIDARDLRELNRDLRALRMDRLLQGELDPLGSSIIKEVGAYPPPVDGNRTGQLGRSWEHRVWGMNLSVENYAGYAGWVHGDEQTARHHRTGWKRIFDVASTRIDKLRDKIGKKVGRIWRS